MMVNARKNATREQLWNAYWALAEARTESGQRCIDQAETWKNAISMDLATRERLWNEYEALSREYDIADARVSVAWARYLAARHNLNESDVFDVE